MQPLMPCIPRSTRLVCNPVGKLSPCWFNCQTNCRFPYLLPGFKVVVQVANAMTRKKIYLGSIFLSVLVLITYACVPDGWSSPTNTPIATITPTASPAPLPDLALKDLAFQPEMGEPCYDEKNRLGVHLIVVNLGPVDAGPFSVNLNGEGQNVESGLPAGGSLSLWFPGYSEENVVILDPNNQVLESDEDNNHVLKMMAIPTLPPSCFPTPEVTFELIEPLATLEGHTGKVWSLDFSPDGKLLASGSVDNTLRLWRVHEAALLRTMLGHPFPILSVKFSPSGIHLATGSDDSLVRVWQVSNASLLQTLQGHAGWVYSVAYSPDGRTIASGSNDFTVRVWRTTNGTLMQTIDEGMLEVLSVAYSPDATILAWGEADGTVRLRSTSEGKWLYILSDSTSQSRSIAFSSDGSLLASGTSDGNVYIWRVSDGALLQGFRAHSQPVNSIAFSPDGEWFVSGSNDNNLRLWKLDSLLEENNAFVSPNAVLVAHSGPVNSVVFSPDGALVASGSDDATIRLWSVPGY